MRVDTIRNKNRPAEILLVEDNYGDVLLTKKAFNEARLPNHISVANDGTQAMAMLRREAGYESTPAPDVILLDLNLPKKSGKEVLAEIKADDRLRHIPVVVLTSSRAEQDVVKSYELHANSYIIKPVGLEQFADIVKTIEQFWFTIVVLPDEPDAGKSV